MDDPAAPQFPSAVRTDLTLLQRLWASDWALFAIISVGAFLVRLIYVLQMRSDPTFAHPSMDELYHDQWAVAISHGREFVNGPFFRAPLYPYFLGFVYKVFGHNYLAPRIIQAALGGINCGLLFWLGRLMFDRTVAFWAGIVASSYLMIVYFDAELLLPVLEVFFDLSMLVLLVLAIKKDRWWLFALCGLALGCSTITRPNIIVFAPAVAIWLWTAYGIKSKKVWGYLALATVGVLVPILPVALRNHFVGHDSVAIASQGGVNFYIGNNPDSDGMRAVVPGTPGDWWGGYYATIAIAEQDEGRKLKPSEVSDYYYNKAFSFIRENPGDAAGLTLRKLQLFWSNWEIPNNKFEDFWAREFTPIASFLPFSFSLVAPFGLLGLFMCFRRMKSLFPLWGFILIYTGTVVAFFITARYRIPILPPLILVAVYGVSEAYRECVTAKSMKPWVALVVLGVSAQLVLGMPKADTTKNLANAYNTLGKAYLDDHQPEKAVGALRRALTYKPEYFTASVLLGEALSELGDLPGAEKAFTDALTFQPSPDWGESPAFVGLAEYNLGATMAKLGRPKDAIPHLERALEEPTAQEPLPPLHELVRILATSPDAGVRDGKQALLYARRLCPNPATASPQDLDDLASALAETGAFDEAASDERLAIKTARSNEPGFEERLALYLSHKPYRSALLNSATR